MEMFRKSWAKPFIDESIIFKLYNDLVKDGFYNVNILCTPQLLFILYHHKIINKFVVIDNYMNILLKFGQYKDMAKGEEGHILFPASSSIGDQVLPLYIFRRFPRLEEPWYI